MVQTVKGIKSSLPLKVCYHWRLVKNLDKTAFEGAYSYNNETLPSFDEKTFYKKYKNYKNPIRTKSSQNFAYNKKIS